MGRWGRQGDGEMREMGRWGHAELTLTFFHSDEYNSGHTPIATVRLVCSQSAREKFYILKIMTK